MARVLACNSSAQRPQNVGQRVKCFRVEIRVIRVSEAILLVRCNGTLNAHVTGFRVLRGNAVIEQDLAFFHHKALAVGSRSNSDQLKRLSRTRRINRDLCRVLCSVGGKHLNRHGRNIRFDTDDRGVLIVTRAAEDLQLVDRASLAGVDVAVDLFTVGPSAGGVVHDLFEIVQRRHVGIRQENKVVSFVPHCLCKVQSLKIRIAGAPCHRVNLDGQAFRSFFTGSVALNVDGKLNVIAVSAFIFSADRDVAFFYFRVILTLGSCSRHRKIRLGINRSSCCLGNFRRLIFHSYRDLHAVGADIQAQNSADRRCSRNRHRAGGSGAHRRIFQRNRPDFTDRVVFAINGVHSGQFRAAAEEIFALTVAGYQNRSHRSCLTLSHTADQERFKARDGGIGHRVVYFGIKKRHSYAARNVVKRNCHFSCSKLMCILASICPSGRPLSPITSTSVYIRRNLPRRSMSPP